MAKKHPSPSRAINRSVSLDLSIFSEKLFRALHFSREEQGFDSFLAGQAGNGGPGITDACNCAGDFSRRYLVREIYSKFSDGTPSLDRERTTLAKFLEAEESCRRTNLRLQQFADIPHFQGLSASTVLYRASQKIASCLGDFDWDEVADRFAFGPGASTRLPRRFSDATYKFSGSPETTLGNLALSQACIRSSPLWLESMLASGSVLTVVRGNKVVTVPKNYKADRTIAIEPDLNMYVQKGIGSVIRSRLAGRMIDLDTQRYNGELARLGSTLDNLATLDLSMASDTVSHEIVRQLLPEPWLDALEQCRSEQGVLPSGEIVTYQKFSSMGNGYTFELETLIFWALAESLIDLTEEKDRRLMVYGDDIIVSKTVAPILSHWLSEFGFKVNEDKSFITGPFRESCGKHYFSGCDVTPFYVRRPVADHRELFLLHNNLYRWCVRNSWNQYWSRGLMSQLLSWIRGHATSVWRRPRLPDGYGDGAFIGTFDVCRPRPAAPLKRYTGWEGFVVEHMVDVSRTRESDCLGRLLKALHHLQRRNSSTFMSHLEVSAVGAGGLSLAPRVRVVKTLIPQFALLDVFQE